MKYDLTTPITDFKGKRITDADNPEGYTLGSCLIRALCYVEAVQGQAQPPAEEKFKAGLLAQKIATAGDSVDLTTEEMALAKHQVGRLFLPLMLVQVWNLLEAHSRPKPTAADIPAPG